MTASPTRAAWTRPVLAAWGVHLLTASGAVAGVLALAGCARGDFPAAALWMLAALSIDAVDGSLARAARVSELLPSFDGRRLDDMVDFLNYVIVAVVFMVSSGHLPSFAWTIPPVLASAYGFSQSDAKTPDHFFLGFPSYWNVMALYLWLLDVSPAAGAAWVTAFSVLVFVPLKYVYPSRSPVLRRSTIALSAAWILLLAWVCARPDAPGARALARASLVFPAWYGFLSLRYGGLHRPRRGAGA